MSMDYRKIPLGNHDQKRDKRDYNLATLGIMADGQYPKVTAPLIKHPIRNQEYTSMCMAFAEAKMLETHHYMETGEMIKVSEGFIYWLKTITNAEGMIPFFDMDHIRNIGAVQAKDFEAFGTWAEINEKMKTCNVVELKYLANKLRAKTTLTLTPVELPAYLHLWRAGMISVNVHDSFYNTGSDGIIPEVSGDFAGGHMMYVDETSYINGVLYASGDNSWGEEWGDHGRFHVRLDHPCISGFFGSVDATPITTEATLTIGSKTMITSKGIVELPIGPLLVNGNTMVPLRAISEMFGKLVEWKPLSPSKPFHEGSQIVIKMTPEMYNYLII